MRVAYRMILPDGRPLSGDADGPSLRLGRDPSCEIALDEAVYPMVSGLHARIEASDGGFILVHESRSNKTLLNDAVVETTHRVLPGDRIKLGYTGPTIEIVSIDAAARPPEPVTAAPDQTIQADACHLGLLRGALDAKRIEIGRGGVIGRDPQSQFPLDHPHVSRMHASLAVRGDRALLADLRSANGTFVNGQRLKKPVALETGDRIDIGPFSLQFDGTGLVSRSRSNNVELSASSLKRVVMDGMTGKPFTVVDDVSLVIRPREFVCLLGPSRASTSTLLAMLSGRDEPDEGAVALNGEDLYSEFEALKGDIAVVPQDDVLHDRLALGAALRYTAELRLPPDTSRDEIESSVSDILDVVGLTERRGTMIRDLSGRQGKRASLANELIARPSLLFLDEVTSGLDEQTDRTLMSLFRELADAGKTIVCVTQNLIHVESKCHLLVILTRDGGVAFVGTPDEAKAYFGVSRLGDVSAKLEVQKSVEWHTRFRDSAQYQRYVAERMPNGKLGDARPITGLIRRRPRRPSILRQCVVLIRRGVSILRGDPLALVVMLAQGLLIAILLGIVFGKLADVSNPAQRALRTVNLQLLLAVSCFWFGCQAAAKELVKERTIFHHERAVNLSVVAYLASKLLVLATISVIQATVLFVIVQTWCQLPGSAALQWLSLALLTAAGTAVGLLISAAARSEELATALIPIVVLPQLILAGVIAPLGGLARWLASWYVTVYWAQQALERLLPDADLALLGKTNTDWRLPFAVVLVHLVIAAIGCLIVLRQSDD